jgi:hypothetical protein
MRREHLTRGNGQQNLLFFFFFFWASQPALLVLKNSRPASDNCECNGFIGPFPRIDVCLARGHDGLKDLWREMTVLSYSGKGVHDYG